MDFDNETRDIRARGLTKRYGNKVVVDNLSFTAKPGVVAGFLGANGAGKSTTMRMLLGLARPSAGTITIGDSHISELHNPARMVGALLEAGTVHPHRTAFDHLLAFAQAAGLGRQRVDEVLEAVGLTAAAGRRAGEFSLGMHQRLGIATALLGDPRVLVLDEPLNGLDPEGIRWLRTMLRDLAREGRTVLFSSHLMSEIELAADDLVVIGSGRLIADAPLDEFLRANSTGPVTARTASRKRLAVALTRGSIRFEEAPGSALLVTGTDTSEVGRIAAAATVLSSVLLSFTAMQLMLSSAGLPAASVGDADVVRAVAGATLFLLLAAVIGVAVDVLTRSTPGSLAVLFGAILIVTGIAPGIPGTIGDWVSRYWPITAARAAYTVVPTDTMVAPWLGIAILAAATAAVTALGHATFRTRRDPRSRRTEPSKVIGCAGDRL